MFLVKKRLCKRKFSGAENGKVFLWNFFEHSKKILRPVHLNPFLAIEAFAVPVSDSFCMYILGHCSVNNGGRIQDMKH